MLNPFPPTVFLNLQAVYSETYSKPCETSKIEHFAKHSILDVSQGSGYVSL